MRKAPSKLQSDLHQSLTLINSKISVNYTTRKNIFDLKCSVTLGNEFKQVLGGERARTQGIV